MDKTTGAHPLPSHHSLARLTLREDRGGLRYFLAGRPVHCGDVVEVLIGRGTWLEVRLEGMPDDLLAYFEVDAGWPEASDGVRGPEVHFPLPEAVFCKWPSQ